jgi:hypothetical protein
MSRNKAWDDLRRQNAKKKLRKNVMGPIFPVTTTTVNPDGSETKKTVNPSRASIQRTILEGEMRRRPRREGA